MRAEQVTAMDDLELAPVLQRLPLLAYIAPGARRIPTRQAPVKMALQSTIPMSPWFCRRRARRRRRYRPSPEPLMTPLDADNLQEHAHGLRSPSRAP